MEDTAVNRLSVFGTIEQVMPSRIVGPNGKETQQILLRQKGNKYPNLICLSLFGDLVGKFQVGENVVAYFQIEAHPTKDKSRWFNWCNVFRIFHA